jgi:dephospho-CoA kinase
MLVYGLTGGIGMGKSTVSSWLTNMGEHVIDTDALARELVSPGQPALDEIRAEFGAEVINTDGSLNRGKLAERVFGEDQSRRKLEAILHPRIRERWQKQLSEWADEGVSRAVVVIPLLYETEAEKALDKVVCVGCSEKTQFERLATRGWSKVEITRRIAAQLPLQQKIDRADYVIWNEGPVDLAERQAKMIFGTGGTERINVKKRENEKKN